MGKVIRLDSYRTLVAQRRGFAPWHKRFGLHLAGSSRVADLPDAVVYYLARPGENGAAALYELIMGILGLGAAGGFDALSSVDKLKVVDIQLFLADQFRFEMMVRLQWLSGFTARGVALMDMVLDFEAVRQRSRRRPPLMGPAHPQSDGFEALTDRDKEAFVRRHLPAALECFRLGLEDDC